MSDPLDLEAIRRATNALRLELPTLVWADYSPHVFALCDEVERLREQASSEPMPWKDWGSPEDALYDKGPTVALAPSTGTRSPRVTSLIRTTDLTASFCPTVVYVRWHPDPPPGKEVPDNG